MAVGSSPTDGGTGPATSESRSWRGVNLGGWLVLEEWMAPSLFSDVAPGAGDEGSLMRTGGAQAREAVTRFRDAFVTQEDFRWLRDVGQVNAVRLPVGFWCLEAHAAGTHYLPTQAYVDAVFDWAEAYGLKVLLDFHGAVGSQNAQHHSGAAGGQPEWLSGSNRAKNLEVLRAWALRWGRRSAFLGLGLGNEVGEPEAPARPEGGGWLHRLGLRACCQASADYWELVADFYADAASRCRPHMRPDAVLVIDTCWNAGRWTGTRLHSVAGPLLLDYHHYECMGPQKSIDEHCEVGDLRKAMLAEPGALPLVLGEFCLALSPQCEGYHDAQWQRRFFERQTGLAAAHGAGWFFWNYKMARDNWPHWSYRECVERGWIPSAAGATGSPAACSAGGGRAAGGAAGSGSPCPDADASTTEGSQSDAAIALPLDERGDSVASGSAPPSPKTPLLAKSRSRVSLFSSEGCEGLAQLGCMTFLESLMCRLHLNRRAVDDLSPNYSNSPSGPPSMARDFRSKDSFRF